MNEKIKKLKKEYDFGVIKFDKSLLRYTNVEKEKYEWVKSIIVFFFPYSNENVNKKYLPAKLAYGSDYHNVLKDELERFVVKLEVLNKYEILVDHGYLDEKKCASKAGLGVIGLNNLFISEEYGSFIVLGEILTDYEIEEYENHDFKGCINCNECIKSCPNNALDNGFDKSKCLSYLNQSKTNRFEELEKIDKVYGCDICQDVCPYNIKSRVGHEKLSFKEDAVLNLDGFLKLDLNSFTNKYSEKSFYWIGYLKILRNLLFLSYKNKELKKEHLLIAQAKNYHNEEWFSKTIEYLKRKIEDVN